MRNYVPLQSHGLKKTKQIWKPPKSRSDFWIADARDEAWMRPLMEPGDGGYWGTLETVPDERYPVDLCDVRDEQGDLIGYSNMNPVEHFERNPYPLQLLVIDTEDLFSYSRKPRAAYAYKTIDIRVIQWSAGGASSERFLCWQVPLIEALHLIESGWIVCIGPDRKNDFFYEVRNKAQERAYRSGYAGRIG